MAQIQHAWQDRWQALSSQEKLIASGLSALIGLVLVYAMIWLPGQHARQRLSISLQQKQAQLAQMKIQAAQITDLQQAVNLAQSHPQDLKAVVSASAKLHNISGKIGAIELAQGGGLGISMNVGFAEWVSWLDTLQSEHHIRVERCHIERADNGNANINATLIAASSAHSSAESSAMPQ